MESNPVLMECDVFLVLIPHALGDIVTPSFDSVHVCIVVFFGCNLVIHFSSGQSTGSRLTILNFEEFEF